MNQYYILRNGNRFGPYVPQQLQQYVSTGQILLYDVACDIITGDCLTVKEVLSYYGLKATLPSGGNIFRQLSKIGNELIFPHTAIFNKQWLSDNRFVLLAIVGLVPLFLEMFTFGSSWLVFYLISLYFSVLWGLIFYYFFRTQQVNTRTAISTFFIAQLCIFFIFDVTGVAYLNPFYAFTDMRFPIDALGYIFGVGLTEETVKILPLIYIAWKAREPLMPQTLVFYGLISGIAFGVYEGVEYQLQVNSQMDYTSSHYLNILRLTSLPFIHAVWCGIGGYFLAFAKLYPRYRLSLYVLMIAVPMLLHGIYDTFCSTDSLILTVIALLSTVVSVILLMQYLRNGANYQSRLRA